MQIFQTLFALQQLNMSDQPLYFKKSIQKTVNPAKILPSLLQLQEKKKKLQNQTITMNPAYLLEHGNTLKSKLIKKQQSKNYRTKMCPLGRDCKRRFTCRFAHTELQLRRPFIKRKNPCLLYQRGQCSLGSACRDYHGNIDLQKNYKYKQKICENYRLGKCEKGDICIFIHQNLQEIEQAQEFNEDQPYFEQIIQKKIDQKQQNEQQNKQQAKQKSQEISNQQNKQPEQICDELPQGFSISFD